MTPSSTVTIAAAVNDDGVLRECLAASPEIVSGALSLRAYRGYPSAALALNAALDESDGEWVALAHQDVYLPSGFQHRVVSALQQAAEESPSVAVCGVIGMTGEGRVRGQTWSTGLGTLVGEPIERPTPVDTLDELILIVRRSSGLRFDTRLPGFHLYGTDIVLAAQEMGLTALAVPVPVVHHSRPVVALGADYAAPYNYLRRKWSARLPVVTLMGGITRNPLHRLRLDLGARKAVRFRTSRTRPAGNPREIAARLGYEAAPE